MDDGSPCRHHPGEACACYCQFFDRCTADNCAFEGYVPELQFRGDKLSLVQEVADVLLGEGLVLALVDVGFDGHGTITFLPEEPGHLDDCDEWLGGACSCGKGVSDGA